MGRGVSFSRWTRGGKRNHSRHQSRGQNHPRHWLWDGCPAIVLAGETGATTIIGIDVQSKLLQLACQYAKDAGVINKVEFRLVEPGPLPFEDNLFDVVLSKDDLAQIVDKESIYREILSVVRTGGAFIAMYS